MKNKRISTKYLSVAIGSACLLALLAQPAWTDSQSKEDQLQQSRRGPDAEQVFEHLDKDGDGVLSKQEFTEAFKKRMERLRGAVKGHMKRQMAQRMRGHGSKSGARVIHIHHHYHDGGESRPHHPGMHRDRGPRHPHRPHPKHREHGLEGDLDEEAASQASANQPAEGESTDS